MPGEPRIAFKMLRQIFKNYLLVLGALGQMLVVGPKCHTALAPRNSVFSTRSRIPEAPSNTATTALVNYFMPKTNVGAERQAFS